MAPPTSPRRLAVMAWAKIVLLAQRGSRGEGRGPARLTRGLFTVPVADCPQSAGHCSPAPTRASVPACLTTTRPSETAARVVVPPPHDGSAGATDTPELGAAHLDLEVERSHDEALIGSLLGHVQIELTESR